MRLDCAHDGREPSHVRSVHIVQIVLKKILNFESCYNEGLILEIIGASLDRCVHDIEIVLMTGGSLRAHNCAHCRLCSHICRFFINNFRIFLGCAHKGREPSH